MSKKIMLIPDKQTLKVLKVTSAAMLFLVILLIIIITYFSLFNMVSTLDIKSYYRYASDGKFDYDVYFYEAEIAETDIYTTLNQVILNSDTPKRTQDFFKLLLKDEQYFIDIINENSKYIDYLYSNQITINDLISYMRKIIYLDDLFLHAAMYIGILLYILILYFGYKWRISIFIFSGILYFILVIDSYMAGIFLDSLFPIIQKTWIYLNEFSNESYIISYEDHLMLSKYFLPATREAALTFIILDTVVQTIRESKRKKQSSKLIMSYFELESAILFLRKMNKDLLVKELKKIDLTEIHQLCIKNTSDKNLNFVKEQLDEIRRLHNENKLTVSELLRLYISIQEFLRKSQYFRTHIIQ